MTGMSFMTLHAIERPHLVTPNRLKKKGKEIVNQSIDVDCGKPKSSHT